MGLLVGSFINVLIYRLPRGESIVSPPSRCPLCGKRLSWLDLVPVLSYLALGGKCRYCGGAISPRYPVVELLTASAFTFLWFRFGLTPVFVKYAFFTGLLIAAAFIDVAHYIIPDKLVLAGLAGAVVLGLGARDIGVWSALAGAGAAGGALLVLALLSRGGMGGGDIKLAAVGGLHVGWPLSLEALFLAAFCGAVTGGILMALGKKGRKDPVPFAPFLALGFFVTAVWGRALLTWYGNQFL